MRGLVLSVAVLCVGCVERALPLEGHDAAFHSDLSVAVDAATDGAQPSFDLAIADAAAARTWQPAVALAPMDPDQAYAPAVAIDDAGGAIVGWRVNRASGGGKAAMSRFDAASKAWAAEQDLPLTASLLTTVTVGLDSGGAASAYQCLNAGAELAGLDPFTGTWSVQPVTSPDATIPCPSTISMPSASRLYALWQPSTGPTASLEVGRYDPFTWSQIAQLDSGSIAAINSLAIAATRDGHVAAIWRGYFPTPVLHAATFDPATQAWSAPVRIDKGPTIAATVSIAIVPSGDALAVWDDASVGKLGTIWVSRYASATDSWSPPLAIGSNAAGPQISWSAGGTAIALWGTTAPGLQPASDARTVWTRYDGSAWSTPSPLLLGPGGMSDAHVAMNAAGEAVAAWAVVDTMGGHAIWASRLE